ncbi:hypothetical protein MP228_004535 [Amoeboaphelidium protococcarum]|nr:hypothetical protein MP228_004535 [Amoeboaphelidium protococcarum]
MQSIPSRMRSMRMAFRGKKKTQEMDDQSSAAETTKEKSIAVSEHSLNRITMNDITSRIRNGLFKRSDKHAFTDTNMSTGYGAQSSASDASQGLDGAEINSEPFESMNEMAHGAGDVYATIINIQSSDLSAPEVGDAVVNDGDNTRVQQSDVQPLCLQTVYALLKSTPRLKKMIEDDQYEDLLCSVIASRVLKAVKTKLNNQQQAQQYSGRVSYDLAELTNLIQSNLETIVVQVANNKKKIIQKSTVVAGRHVAYSEKGLRDSNEDRHFAAPYLNELLGYENPDHSLSAFGIFDGHGGSDCANFIANRLHINIGLNSNLNLNMRKCMTESFALTNQQWSQYADRNNLSKTCGTTAIVALIQNYQIFISWVGDSSAMLFLKNGIWLDFVVPHKPYFDQEKLRIEALGGFVNHDRVNGALAVSRAFGDLKYGCVRPDPDVIEYKLQGNEDFLLLACDGLTDVMTPMDILDVVKKTLSGDVRREHLICEKLVDAALNKGSTDNVSVIYIPLRDLKIPQDGVKSIAQLGDYIMPAEIMNYYQYQQQQQQQQQNQAYNTQMSVNVTQASESGANHQFQEKVPQQDVQASVLNQPYVSQKQVQVFKDTQQEIIVDSEDDEERQSSNSPLPQQNSEYYDETSTMQDLEQVQNLDEFKTEISDETPTYISVAASSIVIPREPSPLNRLNTTSTASVASKISVTKRNWADPDVHAVSELSALASLARQFAPAPSTSISTTTASMEIMNDHQFAMTDKKSTTSNLSAVRELLLKENDNDLEVPVTPSVEGYRHENLRNLPTVLECTTRQSIDSEYIIDFVDNYITSQSSQSQE